MLDDRDIDLVAEEKKQIIRESEALEFYAVHETPADVGGLGVLKQWLRMRERAFTQEARNYGLPSPKGIALIGIPGTGKSLTAKMIGGLWGLPLLRLDVGALFGSLVGESEERTPCFVVATANDISSLPPELLRKGRFDEIFFLDYQRWQNAKRFSPCICKSGNVCLKTSIWSG